MAEEKFDIDITAHNEVYTRVGGEKLNIEERNRLLFQGMTQETRLSTPSSGEEEDVDEYENNSTKNRYNSAHLSFGIDSILRQSGKRRFGKIDEESDHKNEENDKTIHRVASKMDDAAFSRLGGMDLSFKSESMEDIKIPKPETFYTIANHLTMWSLRDINKERIGGMYLPHLIFI